MLTGRVEEKVKRPEILLEEMNEPSWSVLWQLEEQDEEWWRDVERTREKRRSSGHFEEVD